MVLLQLLVLRSTWNPQIRRVKLRGKGCWGGGKGGDVRDVDVCLHGFVIMTYNVLLLTT